MKNSDKVSESEIDWRIRVAEARLIARALWRGAPAFSVSEGMLGTIKTCTWLHSEEMEPVIDVSAEGHNVKLNAENRESVLMLHSMGIKRKRIAEVMEVHHRTINNIIKEALGG